MLPRCPGRRASNPFQPCRSMEGAGTASTATSELTPEVEGPLTVLLRSAYSWLKPILLVAGGTVLKGLWDNWLKSRIEAPPLPRAVILDRTGRPFHDD